MKIIDADKLIQVLEKRFNNCMEGYKKTGEEGWLYLAQAYNMALFEAKKLIYDINELYKEKPMKK